MRVEVRDTAGNLLWSRWTREGQQGGMTSRSYIADGTLDQIVGLLESARQQAVGELTVFQNANAVLDVGMPAAQINRDVPESC